MAEVCALCGFAALLILPRAPGSHAPSIVESLTGIIRWKDEFWLRCLWVRVRSAVGITDAAGKLVGSISIADLPAVPLNNLSLLLKPLSEVGAHVCACV